MDSEAFERWLPTYRQRADTVAAALGALFQGTMTHWVSDESGTGLDITRSRRFLKKQRPQFPHRILFFTSSSQFDEAVESEILDTDENRAGFSESLTPRQILSRKAELLEPSFKQLIYDADILAAHYTVALSANERLRELPLVWDVPAEPESETGFPPDYMWHATFYFLCEISQAIIAYGGYSPAFWDEFTYIRNEPDLAARLLWLDQNGALFFPEREQETWPLNEIAKALDKIG